MYLPLDRRSQPLQRSHLCLHSSYFQRFQWCWAPHHLAPFPYPIKDWWILRLLQTVNHSDRPCAALKAARVPSLAVPRAEANVTSLGTVNQKDFHLVQRRSHCWKSRFFHPFYLRYRKDCQWAEPGFPFQSPSHCLLSGLRLWLRDFQRRSFRLSRQEQFQRPQQRLDPHSIAQTPEAPLLHYASPRRIWRCRRSRAAERRDNEHQSGGHRSWIASAALLEC